MRKEQQQVLDFTSRINAFAEQHEISNRQAIGSTPGVRDGHLRAMLIMEEARETAEALTGHKWEVVPRPDRFIGKPDLAEVADGCADLAVVTLGTAVACGFDLELVFTEVMRANNTKFRSGATFREDGKFVKSPDFEDPDVAGVLLNQGWDGK